MEDQATALLDACRTRADIKRLAAKVEGDPGLRAAVIDVAHKRGVELPPEALDWPAKRLLRRARGLEAVSRVRRNPIRRDEGFTCVVCGTEVPPHGRTARDHCPRCLASLHVDVVPGDRAEDCGGVLEAVAVEPRGTDWIVSYRCSRCGASRVNRALLDGDPPDRWEAIVALSERPPP